MRLTPALSGQFISARDGQGHRSYHPSAKLISENTRLQDKIKAMQKDGVTIEACITCSNAYGVTEDLKKLGYDVKGMGKPLTDYLKSGAKVLTF